MWTKRDTEWTSWEWSSKRNDVVSLNQGLGSWKSCANRSALGQKPGSWRQREEIGGATQRGPRMLRMALKLSSTLDSHFQAPSNTKVTGRTDAEAKAPILWPCEAKNQLIGTDHNDGKAWGQEEKGVTEDEMLGGQHRLNGHEFKQTPGDSEGQGSLVCCGPWGRKESYTTEWLKNSAILILSTYCNCFNNWFLTTAGAKIKVYQETFLLEVRGQRPESWSDSSSGFSLPVSVPLDALDSQVESSLRQ